MIAKFHKLYANGGCPCCGAGPVWGLEITYSLGEARVGKGDQIDVTTKTGKIRKETLLGLHFRSGETSEVEYWHTVRNSPATGRGGGGWRPASPTTTVPARPPTTTSPVPAAATGETVVKGSAFFIFDLSNLPTVEARQQLMADLLDLVDRLPERVAVYDPDYIKTLTT